MKIKLLAKKISKYIIGEVTTEQLVSRGLKVGIGFNRQQGCYIDPTHCFLIEIGDNVTLSIRVTLLAHDASTKKLLGYTKIGRIKVGNNVFIGANSTILPSVEIGDNAIVGANSVVTKNVPANFVVAGNPARVLCTVEEYAEKYKKLLNSSKKFSNEYRFSKKLKQTEKEELIAAVQEGFAFID